jgi:hypothetical protein
LAAHFAGVQEALDTTSLAEFLATGRLTFPFTYYSRVRAQPFGSVHTWECEAEHSVPQQTRSFFEFRCRAEARPDEQDLAEALACAFRNAGHRRSLGRLGKVAIGLSGGLDSRVILASAQGGAPVQAFSLLDEENSEWRISSALGQALGVPVEPIRRDYDYYGRYGMPDEQSLPGHPGASGRVGCGELAHRVLLRLRVQGVGTQHGCGSGDPTGAPGEFLI